MVIKTFWNITFWFFKENKSWYFMWDDSHEISRLVFFEKLTNKNKCRLLQILLGALRVKRLLSLHKKSVNWSSRHDLNSVHWALKLQRTSKQNFAGLGGSVGCAVRLETKRSRVQPPPRSTTFFRGDRSWNIFCGHSLLSADSRRAVVSFWRKNVHNTG